MDVGVLAKIQMCCERDRQKLAHAVDLELSNGDALAFVLLCNQEHWRDPEFKGLVKILE